MKEIYISEELAARAHTEGLSESEIAGVVTRRRAETALVFDPQSGTYSCHAPVGNIMLWVRFYMRNDADLTYCHSGQSLPRGSGVHAIMRNDADLTSGSGGGPGEIGVSYRDPGEIGVSCSDPQNRVVVDDWYFNRTSLITVQDRQPATGAKLSPLLTPWTERGLRCVRCDRTLELKTAEFQYLEQRYRSTLLACPKCELVFAPRELIEYQREQIERLLESK